MEYVKTAGSSSLPFSTSAELAALISDETGTGVFVLSTTPTLVTPILGAATGTSVALTGAITCTTITPSSFTDNSAGYAIEKDGTANSSTAITLGTGRSQRVTLTGNATITLPTLPDAGKEYELLVELIQDGPGNRTVAWNSSPALVWSDGTTNAPAVNSIAGTSTYYMFRGTSGTWLGFIVSSGIGILDGSSAPSGYIGEVISSTILVGSAISLTSTVVANIASVVLSPGDWKLNANSMFDPAGTTTVTKLASGINSTSATMPTAPTGFIVNEWTFTTGADQGQTVPFVRVNPTITTTYYLCVQATFATSTMVGYGVISARRLR